MSYKLTEQETQSEAPKKLPYNLREKREKDAAYRTMIRADLADELYQKIVDIVIVKKKYKDPNFSSKDLAKLLQTNTRYLSAVVNSRFGMNYSCSISRDTEYFSIYSDMSIRTIFCSSSNSVWARAFASSVLPTPVGPRNRNEPMGRLGS